MKHIKVYKIYNEYRDDEYWIVPSKDPHLEIALKKIPECELTRDDMYYRGERRFWSKRLYIFKDEGVNGNKWSWSNDDYNKLSDYKFGGTIKVTQEDLDNWKINNDAKKYNL